MNRRFGMEIQNIVRDGSANHIVLKSRSFSFQNKAKVPNLQGVPRRISYNKEKPIIIEQQDKSNHDQLLPGYLSSCVDHMIKEEKTQNTQCKCFELRKHEDKKMLYRRSQAIDWMVGVHYELKMFPQTLFSAVRYMDEYLFSQDSWDDENIKLIGITAIFIAGKYEQTYRIPCIRQLKKYAPFTTDEIIRTEHKILAALNFKLISDSSFRFMEILAHLSTLSQKNTYIAHYILELSLLDHRFFQFQPSLLGSAVVYLVHKIRKLSPSWSESLIELTKYEENDLRHCAKQLCTLLEQSQSLDNSRSIRKKFSLPEFCEASKIRLQRKAQ